MTRRTFLTLAFAVMAFVIGFAVNPQSAKAQCPNNCTFLITASCSIPPNCFPFPVWTNWQQGMINVTQVNNVNACGTFAYAQPAPCPPLWAIQWASLDGGATRALPNGPAVRNMLPCGIFVCISVTISPTGCVNVNIVPC